MPGLIPENIIDEVIRRTDIVQVVSSYVNIVPRGQRWFGLCPFHSEKTPSFTVSPDKNVFYCFGCNKGGSVIRFLMDIESLSFPEAIRHLAEKSGIEIPDSSDEKHSTTQRKALEELYIKVSNTYQWLLHNHPEAEMARKYLETRKINTDTCDTYAIGWAPSDGRWLYHFLLRRNYSPEFLAASGLFSLKSPEWAFFVDRLMFPVMQDSNRVTAFSGRDLSNKGPKYKNSPETPLYRKSQQLYGLGQAREGIRKNKRVFLCEGNIDVLSCCQSGVNEAVAPLGTAFTSEQARLLRRLTENLILVFDSDDAGIKGTMKAAVIAEEHGFTVQAVHLPGGYDPAAVLEEKGSEELKKIISKPVSIFKYLLYYIIGDESDISGKAQEEALAKLLPYLQAVDSEVRCEAYLKQLAEAVNTNPQTVIREYYSRIKKQKQDSRVMIHNQQDLDTDIVGDELYLMIAIAVKTEYFSALRALLAPEVFKDRRALAIYRVIDEFRTDGVIPRTDMITDKLADDSLVKLILEKALSEEFSEKIEETIKEKIKLINIRIHDEERMELQIALAHDLDPIHTKARLLRIKEIDQEIMHIKQGDYVWN